MKLDKLYTEELLSPRREGKQFFFAGNGPNSQSMLIAVSQTRQKISENYQSEKIREKERIKEYRKEYT